MAHLIVVRRGETDVFRTLKEKLEEPGQVLVIWDRRLRERRAEPFPGLTPPVVTERRRAERRQALPSSWYTLGFVFVPDRSLPSVGVPAPGPG